MIQVYIMKYLLFEYELLSEHSFWSILEQVYRNQALLKIIASGFN